MNYIHRTSAELAIVKLNHFALDIISTESLHYKIEYNITLLIDQGIDSEIKGCIRRISYYLLTYEVLNMSCSSGGLESAEY